MGAVAELDRASKFRVTLHPISCPVMIASGLPRDSDIEQARAGASPNRGEAFQISPIAASSTFGSGMGLAKMDSCSVRPISILTSLGESRGTRIDRLIRQRPSWNETACEFQKPRDRRISDKPPHFVGEPGEFSRMAAASKATSASQLAAPKLAQIQISENV